MFRTGGDGHEWVILRSSQQEAVKETAKALKALTELSSQVWAEGIRDNLQQSGASAPPATTNGCAWRFSSGPLCFQNRTDLILSDDISCFHNLTSSCLMKMLVLNWQVYFGLLAGLLQGAVAGSRPGQRAVHC